MNTRSFNTINTAELHGQDSSSECMSSVRHRRARLKTPLNAHGETAIWLTGGALAVCVLMVLGLIFLITVTGLKTFWPRRVQLVQLHDGRRVMGEITRDDWFTPVPGTAEKIPPAVMQRYKHEMQSHGGKLHRVLFRTGNYELTNRHFEWVVESDHDPETVEYPEWALVIERVEWGRFFGFPFQFRVDNEIVADTPQSVWKQFNKYHAVVRQRWRHRRKLEKNDMGKTAKRREQARLRIRRVELQYSLPQAWAQSFREVDQLKHDVDAGEENHKIELNKAEAYLALLEKAQKPSPKAIAAYKQALDEYRAAITETERTNQDIQNEIQQLNKENSRYQLVMKTADGKNKTIELDKIVRAFPPNRLGVPGKIKVYFSRWREFLFDDPREANSEGGVFPAIIGTVLMTMLMVVLVVPFGVLAALYLREYAGAGPVVSVVRIAINNLASVPSIVFGVFGLGFFCYGVGGYIDGGPSWVLPTEKWFLLLGISVLISFTAFIVSMYARKKPEVVISRKHHILRTLAVVLWLLVTAGIFLLIAYTPFFHGFYRENLPNPTFGKGALIWASFTLALMTLPVVVVATEEALAAVPNSMREGSYACGASKSQTIRRIVLPRALPGIMTGTILAMARGAGEVAPLMLVGAVKLAAELPVSISPAEHFGINRSFMHLGFHIYDLGFQSQNSEAAKPLVFTTTLLLITIIACLNLAAVFLRAKMKRRFVGAKF